MHLACALGLRRFEKILGLGESWGVAGAQVNKTGLIWSPCVR
jgi:hypothetical protein